MSAEFWAILGVGVVLSLIGIAIGDGLGRIEKKLDRLIEEVRYPNLEAQKRDLMGHRAYDEMNEML